MSGNAQHLRKIPSLCERIGKEHDVELSETYREWHIYRCMRCNTIITAVPVDFVPSDITLESEADER